ncbi:hypothetical protein [Tardiphaga sp.]|jgi:hypothetical protein|uniref:hypothetical protein n=1 Tax=Tardiphaga sp. TaxID=1926292 RepID=UPI0037D9F8D9
MTTRALVVKTIDLKPNPPPYGELHLRKGAWDQLQASKAYRETLSEAHETMQRQSLDLEI